MVAPLKGNGVEALFAERLEGREAPGPWRDDRVNRGRAGGAGALPMEPGVWKAKGMGCWREEAFYLPRPMMAMLLRSIALAPRGRVSLDMDARER